MPYLLGRSRRGTGIALSNTERSTHLHLVGASGSGKSKLLEALIRQDILVGRGLCLLDPHGGLADAVLTWCASRQADKWRKIHVVTPADLDWSAGFNPLRLDTVVEPQARVDAMVSACAQVWGGEDLATTPLLKRCLKAVFYVLAVRELTLVEATELITVRHAQTLRRTLTEDLPNPVFDAQWGDFNALSNRDFLETFGSTNNRLVEFLSSPVVRRMVGQRRNVIDLRRAMDEGEIVIVNLSGRGVISEENSRLIGTLLTSELFLLAKARSPEMAKRRPFTLYIDECYQFITNSIERMLDETRKFGLHVVLSHQRLLQLGDPKSAIYNGVMAGGQTKVVFGGLADEDAEVMARHVFRSTFNLERPKHILDKPVVADAVPYWLESESQTESHSSTSGSASSTSTSYSSTTTEGGATDFNWPRESGFLWSAPEDPFRYSISQSTSGGRSDVAGSSAHDSSTNAYSKTHGRSQTLKSVRVVLPTTVYSLEEELHRAIVKLRDLPRQTAIVKRPSRPPVRMRPETVKDALVRPERIAAFIEQTRRASDCLTLASTAEAEMAERRVTMRGGPAAPADQQGDPFWAEEVA